MRGRADLIDMGPSGDQRYSRSREHDLTVRSWFVLYHSLAGVRAMAPLAGLEDEDNHQRREEAGGHAQERSVASVDIIRNSETLHETLCAPCAPHWRHLEPRA
jgi:hypothetical protein